MISNDQSNGWIHGQIVDAIAEIFSKHNLLPTYQFQNTDGFVSISSIQFFY